MSAGPKTLAALKMLAAGRPIAYVQATTGMPTANVEAIANANGYPDLDRLAANANALTAQLAQRDALVDRAPATVTPLTSRPPQRPAPQRPATTPAAGGTPEVSKQAPASLAYESSVNELVRACRRSDLKRTQALGPKLAELAELAERIITALRTEREAAEMKTKQAEEIAAKKAAVDKLTKALAAAKADLAALSPGAALEFVCEVCGDSFSTSSGRARHTTRKHPTDQGDPA